MLTQSTTWTRLQVRLPKHAYQPCGFAAGDTNLYRYVGNNPTNRTDPSGLDDQTRDELYETLLGIQPAIKDKKLETNREMSFSFISKSDIRGTKSRIVFSFSKAYIGNFTIPGEKGPRYGMYVKIEAFPLNVDNPKYEELRFIQVVRTISMKDGKIQTESSGVKIRDVRSGWGDEKAPSRGWRVDVAEDSTTPYYGLEGLTAVTGVNDGAKKSRHAVLYDAPSTFGTNQGAEFITTLVGFNKGQKGVILGYVRWGYYRDNEGKLTSLPFKEGRVGTDLPQEVKDAIKRWNGIEGNKMADVELN